MKTSIIHSKFWQDSFIEELTVAEKALFLYFLTNDQTNILFCYECSDKRILFETGCTKEQLEKFKEKVQKAGKIFFKDGYVYLKNAHKYQKYSGDLADKGKDNIKRHLSSVISDWLDEIDKGCYKPPSKGVEGDKEQRIINKEQEIKNKELINKEDKSNLIQYLIEKGMDKDLVEEQINKFINYWTEKSKTGKERWELEKVFEVKKRLATWFSNINKFNGGKNEKRGYRL